VLSQNGGLLVILQPQKETILSVFAKYLRDLKFPSIL